MPWPPFTTAVRWRRRGRRSLLSFIVMEMGYYIHFSGDRRLFCPIMAQMTRNCTAAFAARAPAPLPARSFPLRFSLVSVGSGRGCFLWYLVTFMQPGPSGGGQRRGKRPWPDGHA